MRYRVTLLKGDGIGPEVTGATVKILAAAGAPIDWEEAPAGLEAVEKYGVPMPEVTLQSLRKTRLGLKGPLMTPKGRGFRSANVSLRKSLDLYVGLRPVRSIPGIVTPYKDVDLVVLRDLLFHRNPKAIVVALDHADPISSCTTRSS